MPPVIIEELDDDLTPEQHFDALLRFHGDDAKQLLAATFSYVKSRSPFFDDPDASKVLARLLRDVKGPAVKPTPAKAPSSQQSAANVGSWLSSPISIRTVLGQIAMLTRK